MDRCLVYFVAGGDRDYSEILQYAVNTIRSFAENQQIDIVVLCADSYLENLAALRGADVFALPNCRQSHPSLAKVEIFDAPFLRDYDKVLYLDCDIIVCGSLLPVFEAIEREDCLYVVPEKDDQGMHESPYYSRVDRPYSPREKSEFARKGILPFNAGQFGFRVSEAVACYFHEVRSNLVAYDPALHLLEQPFMNEVFNKNFAVSYDLQEFVRLFSAKKPLESRAFGIINHFVDLSVPWREKLARMREAWLISLRQYRVPIVEGRNQMRVLVGLPNACRIVEIGSFRGEFAEKLLNMYTPAKLVLIDPFEGLMCSGDADGNNVEWFDGASNYRCVLEKFARFPNVEVIKAKSCEVSFPKGESAFDLVYVDGDHSAPSVAYDLGWALRHLKSGGFICGHDYAVNPAKTSNKYNFGVKEAVDKFCLQHGFRISGIMMDGCVGYVIQVS